MYNDDFWYRVTLQQICAFFSHGGEGGEPQIGTYKERYNRYIDAMYKGMEESKKLILKTDWDEIPKHDYGIKLEEIFKPVVIAGEWVSDLNFEVGILTGLKLAREFFIP